MGYPGFEEKSGAIHVEFLKKKPFPVPKIFGNLGSRTGEEVLVLFEKGGNLEAGFIWEGVNLEASFIWERVNLEAS